MNFGKILLAFIQNELTVSDVLFRLIPVSFAQRESNKVHLEFWIGSEARCGVRVQRKRRPRSGRPSTPHPRPRPTATATHALALARSLSHTWPRHTIDFRRGSPPPSPSVSPSSLQFYIRENPIYTLLLLLVIEFHRL